MSEHEKDSLDCLFSDKRRQLVNVKFCRGNQDVISEQEFHKQIHSIAMQKRLNPGLATSQPPQSGLPPVDVREFVAKL